MTDSTPDVEPPPEATAPVAEDLSTLAQGPDGSRHRLRFISTSVVGLGLLIWVVFRIPFPALRDAVVGGPALWLIVYSIAALVAALLLDTWATKVGLSAIRIDLSVGELLWPRGASYLVGLVNFSVGQGVLGYHLSKIGIPIAVAIGATGHIVVVNAVVLALMVGVGTSIESPLSPPVQAALSSSIMVGFLLLLGLWLYRPAWITKRTVALPFFGIGLTRQLTALGARLAHQLLFAALYWVAIRIWGIQVPFGQGLVIVTLLMFIAAVPVTPYGLGTVQLAQLALLTPWVESPNAVDREASVLAFSLVHYAASMATQAVLGYICWLGWLRRLPELTARSELSGDPS